MQLNERTRFLHHLRRVELDASLESISLSLGARVLDFGAGDGVAAKLLSERGFEVVAVDINPRYPQLYPVIKVDAEGRLPFSADSFDLIYASNVMEHVVNLPATLDEFRRILKPSGFGVFTMPTPLWRACSLLELPLAILANKYRPPLYQLAEKRTEKKLLQASPPPQRKGKLKRAVKFVSKPHGAFPSAFHELITFSEPWWRSLFTRNRYRVVAVRVMPLFYTGGMLFPWHFLTLRGLIPTRLTASFLTYYVKLE